MRRCSRLVACGGIVRPGPDPRIRRQPQTGSFEVGQVIDFRSLRPRNLYVQVRGDVRVPDSRGLVGGGRDDAPPIGRPCSRPDAIVVAGEDGQLHASGRVPDASGAVKGGGDDASPIGRPCSRPDLIAMAGEDGELFGRVRVPDARGLVKGCGDDAPPVGRERRRPHHIGMAGEHRERPRRGRVPDTRGLVGRRGDDAPPVGRERGRADRLVMAGSTASCLPVAASQMRAVLSLEAVTIRRPSGENTALRTFPPSSSGGRPSP